MALRSRRHRDPAADETGDRRYTAFIRYRHADNRDEGRRWAEWIHQALESFEIPEDLSRAHRSRGTALPSALYPVFRDEEELPADADLSASIRRALENSSSLIVVCSPRACESRFVDEEIRVFKELGRADRILPLLIDGEPGASERGEATDSSRECLPRALRRGSARPDGSIDWTAPVEPIAADARPGGRDEQGFTSAAAYRAHLERQGVPRHELQRLVREYSNRLDLARCKIIAGVLGVAAGEVQRRDLARRAARLRRAVIGLSALVIAAGAVAWFTFTQWRNTVEERMRSQQAEARSGVATARRLSEGGRPAEAIAHLARAWQSDPSRLEAAGSMLSLLAETRWMTPLSNPVALGEEIDRVIISPDGRRVLAGAMENPASDCGGQRWHLLVSQAGGRLEPAGSPLQLPGCDGEGFFSPDGNYALVGTEDRENDAWVNYLIPIRGEGALGPPKPLPRVERVRFSSGGRFVVEMGFDGVLTGRAWALPDLAEMGEADSLDDGKEATAVYSATVDGGTIRVFDETGAPVGEPMHQNLQPSDVFVSADGRHVFTLLDATDGYTLWRTGETLQGQDFDWDEVRARSLPRLLHVEPGSEEGLGQSTWATFSPGGHFVALTEGSSGIHGSNRTALHRLDGSDFLGPPIELPADLHSAAFATRSHAVALGFAGGIVQVWSIDDAPREDRAGEEPDVSDGSQREHPLLQWNHPVVSPDSEAALDASPLREVWRSVLGDGLDAREVTKVWTSPSHAFLAVFVPASVGQSWIWTRATNRRSPLPPAVFAHSTGVLDADESLLAFASTGGPIHLVSIDTHRQVQSKEAWSSGELRFTKDSAFLLERGFRRTRVFDTRELEEVATYSAPELDALWTSGALATLAPKADWLTAITAATGRRIGDDGRMEVVSSGEWPALRHGAGPACDAPSLGTCLLANLLAGADAGSGMDRRRWPAPTRPGGHLVP